MNKFFDVSNKGHKHAKSHFIIAKDEKHARKIASTEPGTPEQVVELPIEENLQKLIESGDTGILAKQIIGFTADQLFGSTSKPKPIANPWFFIKKIK